jgi:hypothetical protein
LHIGHEITSFLEISWVACSARTALEKCTDEKNRRGKPQYLITPRLFFDDARNDLVLPRNRYNTDYFRNA